ncbi:MAG: gluconokinase [Chitinophagaceae bacterium]|nr:gluconokinase [Chitinophagaceae bacterium]
MNYFLGVDIGTTSVKAIAFNERGDLIFRHATGYDMQHPAKNYSEQNAEEIFEAVVLSMNRVMDELHPMKPGLVSFSAMMHSVIAVNEKGNPITNCIIWADNRAAAIAKQIRETAEGEQFYHATGVPIHAMSPFCKLLWLREHEPEIFHSAYKFIGIKEYIFFKLFGRYIVDTAIASATGLLNIHSLDWDTPILDALELAETKLSQLVPVEYLLYYNDESNSQYFLNLPAGTPFVVGSSDGALANLGTGSVSDDSMSVTIGTSAAVRILSDRAITDKDMSIFCYHANGDQYIIGGASNNGAVVMQWLKESLLQTTESYEQLFDLAATVSIANDDLFFVPYILGERAPVWNSEAKGVFCGLTINHTKAHLVRAVIEGITYNLFSIGKLIMKTGTVKQIYAAGGFAESPLWLQLLADIFNCRVLVTGSLESSALGAVIVGVKALNIPVHIQPSIVAEYEPDLFNHKNYLRQFYKFERLYKLLKNEFVNTNPVPAPIPA